MYLFILVKRFLHLMVMADFSGAVVVSKVFRNEAYTVAGSTCLC